MNDDEELCWIEPSLKWAIWWFACALGEWRGRRISQRNRLDSCTVGHHKTPPVTYSARNVSVMNSPGSLELERLSFAKKTRTRVCARSSRGTVPHAWWGGGGIPAMGPLKMNAQMVLWSSDGSPIEHTRMHSQCVVYATSSVKQPFTFHFFFAWGWDR